MRADRGCYAATGGAEGGGDGDVGNGLVHRQHRAGVEAIPADPEDQAAEGGNRQVVAGNRLGLAFHELADPGAQDDRADDAGPGADGMHKGGAGEIDEAQLV